MGLEQEVAEQTRVFDLRDDWTLRDLDRAFMEKELECHPLLYSSDEKHDEFLRADIAYWELRSWKMLEEERARSTPLAQYAAQPPARYERIFSYLDRHPNLCVASFAGIGGHILGLLNGKDMEQAAYQGLGMIGISLVLFGAHRLKGSEPASGKVYNL